MTSTSNRPAAGAPAANQFGVFAVHNVTEAQASYIRSMLATKDLSGLGKDAAEIVARVADELSRGLVSKKLGSSALDVLVTLPKAAQVSQVRQHPANPATERQLAFITKLRAERGASALTTGDVNVMTTREASAEIDRLLATPKAKAPAGGRGTVEAGMYVLADGAIYRAYLGQQSGQILCKEVVTNGSGDYDLEYRGLATRFIGATARRMTLEEAKSWGRATGSCCVCGRRLDVPESVDAGIGPVCGGRV